MASRKRRKKVILGAAVIVVLVLIAIPIFLNSSNPTGQATQPSTPAPIERGYVNEQQNPPANPPAVPTIRDEMCRQLVSAGRTDFDTCMTFLYRICFGGDCGPFSCQGNKCQP